MEREALIFLHIPKTAGTTLNRIIDWQYSPFSIFTIDAHQVRATAERFKSLPERRRCRFRVVRGHLLYGIHEFLPQGATYITLLREPVARVLSSYNFISRDPLNPLHRKFRKERLTVEDLIRLTPNRQNLQCRFRAGIGAIRDVRMRRRSGRVTSGRICEKRMLDLAKENLRSFRVVGLCERFQESLLLMITSFGWNVSFYQNRKVSKIRSFIEPHVVDVIHEHIASTSSFMTLQRSSLQKTFAGMQA